MSFNSPNGFVITDRSAGAVADTRSDFSDAMTLDGAGNILVVGFADNTSGKSDAVVWRVDSTGVLDATFGTGGILALDNLAGGNGDESFRGVKGQANGKIVVSGRSNISPTDQAMVLMRLNDDGSPDTGFASSGIFMHDSAAGGAGIDDAQDFVIDADGRFVLVGHSFNGTDLDVVVWRITADGALDTSFGPGGSGFVVLDSTAGGPGDDQAIQAIIDNDGKIVGTGISSNGTDTDLVVWRFNP